MDNLLLKIDETVTGVVREWDIYTTTIAASIVSFLLYQFFTGRDPDTHPFLLNRQAQGAPIRQAGESAVFRSNSSPHGYPLSSGLGVKDPGDSRWSKGRDGDLRDVWQRVVTGVLDKEGNPTGELGKILTVLGTENVVEHDIADITRQINLIGTHVKQNGAKNVAIYLPNSVEFLATLFACAYYDLTAILVPYNQPIETIVSLLKKSNADTVIAAVGSFPFDAMTQSYPALKQLVWVVDEGSKHLDWNEIPNGTGGAVIVSTWSEIIQEQEPTAGTELPESDREAAVPNVVSFWPSGEVVEYTQANLVAGIAGQLTSIPAAQRISHADLFLPADSLSTVYPLVLTLGALFSNASVALNSVADKSPDLVYATQGIAPTIIVASSSTLARSHSETAAKLGSPLYRLVHWFQTRSLVQQGVMPLATIFSRCYDSLRPVIGTKPGKLRLVYVSEQVSGASTPLSPTILSDLRIYLGARIIYALTVPKVAGAVTQTDLYDYRVDPTGKQSHFGSPVNSVEYLFRDTKDHKTTDVSAAGEIIVRGPAVVGGEAALKIDGKVNHDFTLSLL